MLVRLSMRAVKKSIIALLLLIAVSVYPQDASKKSVIQWKAVENASEYHVEIKGSGYNKSFSVNATELLLDLEPGDYEYRVGSANKFGKVKLWSDWKKLSIVKAVEPELISPDQEITVKEQDLKLKIKGKNFFKNIKVEIFSSSGSIPIKTVTRTSSTEIGIVIDPANLPVDSYKLVLTNPPEKKLIRENFIRVIEPSKPEEIAEGKETKEVSNTEEVKNITEVKESKNTKTAKEITESKESKVAKEITEVKDAKKTEESKETRDVKEISEVSETKEGKESKDTRTKSDKYSALWRSALIPGWGQYYKGDNLKALLIGGSFLAVSGVAYNFYQEKQSHIENFYTNRDILFLLPGDKNLIFPAIYFRSQALTERESAYKSNFSEQTALGALAGIYIYNLVDAYFVAPKKNRTDSQSGFQFQFNPLAGRESVQLGYTFRF